MPPLELHTNKIINHISAPYCKRFALKKYRIPSNVLEICVPVCIRGPQIQRRLSLHDHVINIIPSCFCVRLRSNDFLNSFLARNTVSKMPTVVSKFFDRPETQVGNVKVESVFPVWTRKCNTAREAILGVCAKLYIRNRI